MALYVRAIYENGKLRLLDPVELSEGEEVLVVIESTNEPSSGGNQEKPGRKANLHPGVFIVSDDFDDPLPDEFWLGKDNSRKSGLFLGQIRLSDDFDDSLSDEFWLGEE